MDEVDFGGDISSQERFEILEFLHDLKQHWEQKTKRSTKTRPRLPAATGLAVPASSNRVSRTTAVRSGHPACSTPTSVGEQLVVALDLCDKIQGALSQQPETPLVGTGTSSDQTVQQDGSASGKPAKRGELRAAGRPVSHIDVLKSLKQPQSLKDRDQQECFSFQVETYLALLSEEFPDELA